MPELPEVETTLRGIAPYVEGAIISDIVVRNTALRWPVPVAALQKLVGYSIDRVERRAKYILLHTSMGTILLHLGMSGSLLILEPNAAVGKHDHVDIKINDKHVVRLNDPRRFGCCLLLSKPVFEHKLLLNLGPEPLSDAFTGDVLFKRARARSVALKSFIMDSKIVVGVGNIYASESLYRAGIRPTVAAKRVSRKRYHTLANSIRMVLDNAIKAGGTTLNDFTQADGKPGYFKQELQVYGRAGEPCKKCNMPIKSQMIGQRSSFFCSTCQSF